MDQDFVSTYLLPFLNTPLSQITPKKLNNQVNLSPIERQNFRESRIIHQSVKLEPLIEGNIAGEIVKRCQIPSSYILYKKNKFFIPSPIAESTKMKLNTERHKTQPMRTKQTTIDLKDKASIDRKRSQTSFQQNSDLLSSISGIEIDFSKMKKTIDVSKVKQDWVEQKISDKNQLRDWIQSQLDNDYYRDQIFEAKKIINRWQYKNIQEDIKDYNEEKKTNQMDILKLEHQRHKKKIHLNRLLLKRL